jgi:CheY-like chemotaxis protein
MAYKVIVADSSPSVQKAVELALPAPEFTIFPFSDGLEAINAIAGLRPDAILAGLSLPTKDGYEVAGFARSQEGGRQIALFFVRGAFEPLDLRKVSEVDHDGIIVKPFDGESLADLVREAIDRKKELPSLPEEPVVEEVVEPEKPPESVPAAGPAVLGYPGELEEKIRAIVREEIRNNRGELEQLASEVVSAEFKKMLVEELKGIDTRKI